MDLKLQTSFIPKKMSGVSLKRNSSIGFFTVGSWVLFIGAVLIAGGLFIFNYLTTQDIARKEAELKTKTANFQVADVQDLVRLNNRMVTARSILNSHLTVSKLFDLVSSKTIQSVQFTGFSYTANGNVLSLVLTGKAPDFSSVALQSDTFSKLSYLKDQIFSDLSLAVDGRSVLFKFTATVDPSVITYAVAAPAGAGASASVPVETVPSTGSETASTTQL